MRLLAALVLSSLLVTGCFGGGKQGTGDGSAATASATGTSTGPGAAGGVGSLSLDAPQWQVGQSWKWSVSAQVVSGDLTVTTTVLGVDGAAYDVGVASVDAMVGLYPFHLVATGPVDATTLAWQAHGGSVQLLRFPLVDGDQFTTDLWGAPGANVFVEAMTVAGPNGEGPGFRAVAYYAGTENVFLVGDYLPALGQFVRVATYFGGEAPFAEATLVGVAPTPEDPVPFRVTDLGRIAAAAGDPGTLAPVQGAIPADADAILLACFMGGSQGPATAELTGGGVSGACAYDPSSGIRPPYNWAFAPVQSGGPSTLTGQVAAGSAVFEGFAIDTTP